MRFGTVAVLLTATFASLSVALPGEEAFNRVPRSQPDRIPPPRPPRPLPPPPGPPPDRPLPPIPRPLPDGTSRHHKRQPEYDFDIYARELYERDPLGDFNRVPRSQPDRIPPPRPPRPLPPPPGPPPDRPLPPIPRPLPDGTSRHHKRQPEPEYDFDIYARDLDLEELYERDLDGDFGLDERDFDEALELYERGFGEDIELYE